MLNRELPPFFERPRVAADSHCQREYAIEVITPIFGGGSEAGRSDKERRIRGSSVRGHLRFWWRATRGARYETVAELREREFAIWGSTERASEVSLRVAVEERGEDQSYTNWRNVYPAYAISQAWNRSDAERAVAVTNVRFRLHVMCPPKQRDDVEAAVWAWIHFGGIGSRTRRGCGALLCKELAPAAVDPVSIQRWYEEYRKRYDIQLSVKPQGWPTLPDKLWVRGGESAQDAIEAWKHGINLLRDFRQGVNVGRNPGNDGRPGRSRWPEADSLRRLSKRTFPLHGRSITLSEGYAFPRAEFGLPIIFHFKDRDEPNDTTLIPGESKSGGRLASPLIIRPLACCDGASRSASLILHLRTQPLQSITLQMKNGVPHGMPPFPADAIRGTHLTVYDKSPMKGRSPQGSALEAFLAFAKERGYIC